MRASFSVDAAAVVTRKRTQLEPVMKVVNRRQSNTSVETPSTDMSKVCPKDCDLCPETKKATKVAKKVATKKVAKKTK